MRYKELTWENHGRYETLYIECTGLYDYDSGYQLLATDFYYSVAIGLEVIEKGNADSLVDSKRACYNAMINWCIAQAHQVNEIEKDMREELEKLND